MKVFISVPIFNGLTGEDFTTAEVQAEIDRIKAAIPLVLNISSDEIEFLNPTFTGYDNITVPDGADKRLCYLSNDIQLISQADYVYFARNWEHDKMTHAEHYIAYLWSIKSSEEN